MSDSPRFWHHPILCLAHGGIGLSWGCVIPRLLALGDFVYPSGNPPEFSSLYCGLGFAHGVITRALAEWIPPQDAGASWRRAALVGIISFAAGEALVVHYHGIADAKSLADLRNCLLTWAVKGVEGHYAPTHVKLVALSLTSVGVWCLSNSGSTVAILRVGGILAATLFAVDVLAEMMPYDRAIRGPWGHSDRCFLVAAMMLAVILIIARILERAHLPSNPTTTQRVAESRE